MKEDYFRMHIEEFSQQVTETENGLVKDAVLAVKGTHRGFEFTEEVLQDLAKSVNESGGVPLQIDHSQSVRDTVGFLESATVEDGKLIGKVRILDESIQKQVKDKRAKKLSIGFTHFMGIPKTIKELSLVVFPQIKEATLFKEAEQVVNFKALSQQVKEMKEELDKLNKQATTRNAIQVELAREAQKLKEKKVEEDYYKAHAEKFNW
ncbi:hypothetical protein [Bacillus pseudomycoides]|uniref:hypothetical protein n=1 Tax=Bacillus pseudomycoides TaxID=64104 RepID=UPI001596C888|nr:hypothetical protein [Bacillus pseudomycoides]